MALPSRLVIATRQSALAQWQACNVRDQLIASNPGLQVEILGITTRGDRDLSSSLAKIGGKGLFVKELETALVEGRADIAVHSMKDVPMILPAGLTIAAITEREDPRDAFVSRHYARLSALPYGSSVGTSSLRRASQIRAHHPRLSVEPLRGNVETRLRRLDEGRYAAIILAAAGLKRLGLAARITALLDPEDSLPAAGQGALGIECLEARADLMDLLAPLAHAETGWCVRAERAVSRALSGSCVVPMGVYAERLGAGARLRSFVADPGGTRFVTADVQSGDGGVEPEELGARAAEQLLAGGAGAILAALADE
ncbi:MAG TPA: hydroxymethylbilane synthase [Burkholderiales bacterium]|nr:hydroxymethylbilane synthase [Burkholderiales bacterium]